MSSAGLVSATAPNSNPRFYIPSSSYVSPTLPASSRSSLHIGEALHSRFLADHDRSSTVSFRRRLSARAGGGGLAAALGSYRIPSPIDADDGETQGGPSTMANANDTITQGIVEGPQTPRQAYDPWTRPYPSSDPFYRSNSGSRSALDFSSSTPSHPMDQPMGVGYTVPPEIIDALVDIHRVLYRGREDRLGKREEGEEWVAEMREVRRVVERWFEGDCVYDHPLVRVPTRSSLLNHFILLHLLSSASLPAPTPTNVIRYTKWMIQGVARRMIQSIGLISPAEGYEPELGRSEKGKSKGKGRAVGERRSDPNEKASLVSRAQENGDKRWKLWEVGAECKEIGGLECYDGYHLGLIEHVITLTILPSLTHRPPPLALSLPSNRSSFSSLDLAQPPAAQVVPAQTTSGSFPGRLAGALVREFEYLLHWDLPISTAVHFNEVGRATHIRDTIDIQDLIETFVPFAKRLSWITRRVTGLMSSTLGNTVTGLLPGGKVLLREREHKDPEQEAIALQAAIAGPSTPRAQSSSNRPVQTHSSSPSTPPRNSVTTVPAPRSGRGNSLRLQGLGVDLSGMAPDRDETVV